MTDLTRWVAESDPWICKVVAGKMTGEHICFYCEHEVGFLDTPEEDQHFPGCQFVRAREWVKQRKLFLSMKEVMKTYFPNYHEKGHEDIPWDDGVRLEDDEHSEDEPTEERPYPRQGWWFGD